MPRFINPEDWFLVLTILAGVGTFPLAMAFGAMVFGIPMKQVFDRGSWATAGQLIGIVAFILLLIQAGIDSDGLGAKLIYGRF